MLLRRACKGFDSLHLLPVEDLVVEGEVVNHILLLEDSQSYLQTETMRYRGQLRQ